MRVDLQQNERYIFSVPVKEVKVSGNARVIFHLSFRPNEAV
jgi:hypothetical protein